jgi:hypothetical protein
MTAKTPVVLYVGEPIAFAHEDWVRFQQRFNIITHEYTKPEEIISALKPGGKYDSIQAIVRPSNPTAERDVGPFTKELIAHLPPSLKIISSVNHGYENEDTEELGRKGILYCNGAGGGKFFFPPAGRKRYCLTIPSQRLDGRHCGVLAGCSFSVHEFL